MGTSKKVASKAAKLIKTGKTKAIRSVAASDLEQRKRRSTKKK